MLVYLITLKNDDSDDLYIHSIWNDKEKAQECYQSLVDKQDSSLSHYEVMPIKEHELCTKETKFAPWHQFYFKQTGELIRHETGDKRIEDTCCYVHKFNDVIPHDPEIGGCINVFVITDYENALKLSKEAFKIFMDKNKGKINV